MKPRLPTVGVFVESSREAGRRFLRGVAAYVRAHDGWSVYWHPEGLQPYTPGLSLRKMDAVIARDVKFTREMLDRGSPVVVFGHIEIEFPKLINVCTESETIGRMAAEHLLSCGFSQFAYCGVSAPGRPFHWCDTRREAFMARIKDAGLPCTHFNPLTFASDWIRERKDLVAWVGSLPRPVGVMAANDDCARELAAACNEAGLRVPEDVGIIGVDNDELVCEFSEPPLSSIALGFEQAGYEAAEALDGALQGRKLRTHKIIASASHLCVRRSTDLVAVADANLAKALRFILDHVAEGDIAVPEVARAAGLSRRILEKRFREKIGKSIKEHIRDLRVNRIAEMLVESDLPVAAIADELRFQDVQHFARYFRGSRGMAPFAFRKAHRLQN